MNKKKDRGRYIVRGSIVGLLANLFLFCIKIFAGTLSGSVSVVADAFNNLSDMGASLVTLLGFKMAEKPSDAKHPFGHGRIEYLSGLIVSFIILLLGVELAGSAVGKIFHGTSVTFSLLSVVLLCVSIPVKLSLGFYTRGIGRKINSPALVAAGRDSLNDVLVTLCTLLSIFASRFTQYPVDGVIGLFLAGFVIWSGIGILRDTLGPLLGQAPPMELVCDIEKRVLESEGVTGTHDLIVHNYGPGQFFASVHAEVRADCDILKIHDTIDLAERRIQEELGVFITIHIDPVDTDDALTLKLRELTEGIIRELDAQLSLHDFRIVSGDTHTNLIFDLVVPLSLKMDDKTLGEEIDARLKRQNPDYYTVITFDRAFI